MKQVFFTLALVGLASCSNKDKYDHVVEIMGVQHDYTQDTTQFVSDSVFINNQKIIDSLTTVSELLDHLETLRAEQGQH